MTLRRRERTAGKYLIPVFGAAATLAATALAIQRPAFLIRQDYRGYDSMVHWAGPAPPTGRVVMVNVDDRSLSEIGRWPWRRDTIGRLVDRIRDEGASAIALDILMAEPDRSEAVTAVTTGGRSEPSPASDAALEASIRRGRVVLGYAMTFASRDADRASPCMSHPLTLALTSGFDAVDGMTVYRATGAICNLPQLENAAAASGFLNAVPDVDGILRRVPLVIDYGGSLYPALALAAVVQAEGAPNDALHVREAGAGSLLVGDRRVPLDGRGNLMVRHRRKGAIPVFSAGDVMRGLTPAGSLRDKVVFIGATALGSQDLVTTPIDSLVPGVEAQAMVADNLLQRDFLVRPGVAAVLEAIAVLGCSLLVTIAGAAWGLAASAGGAVVALAFIWFTALWAFSAKQAFLSPVLPTLGIAAALMAVGLAAFVRERFRADRAASDLDRSRHLVVQSLLALTEARDADTGQHSRRTQAYARLLAVQLAGHPRFRAYLTRERIDFLAALAPLHDIGKVAVPDRVLNKPGPLTVDEYTQMQQHPVYGRDVIVRAERQVGALDDPMLIMAKEIVHTHHERWDGGGYPQGLQAEQIPIPGRLVALVDFYDALVSKRPYREPVPFDDTVALIVEGRGTHFDPAVVDAFLAITPELRRSLAPV